MANDALTETQQTELQQGLVSELQTDTDLKATFCRCWPCAKDVLQIILKLPKLPTGAAAIINAIIKAGDLAYSTVCKA